MRCSVVIFLMTVLLQISQTVSERLENMSMFRKVATKTRCRTFLTHGVYNIQGDS